MNYHQNSLESSNLRVLAELEVCRVKINGGGTKMQLNMLKFHTSADLLRAVSIISRTLRACWGERFLKAWLINQVILNDIIPYIR
jgi:hypothetical protein